jgi:hypothetical protein
MKEKRFGPRVRIAACLPVDLHRGIARKAKKDSRSKAQTITILLMAARAFLRAKNIIEKPRPTPAQHIDGWLSVRPPTK